MAGSVVAQAQRGIILRLHYSASCSHGPVGRPHHCEIAYLLQLRRTGRIRDQKQFLRKIRKVLTRFGAPKYNGCRAAELWFCRSAKNPVSPEDDTRKNPIPTLKPKFFEVRFTCLCSWVSARFHSHWRNAASMAERHRRCHRSRPEEPLASQIASPISGPSKECTGSTGFGRKRIRSLSRRSMT